MDSKEILEGNRLIAFFDGGVIEKNGPNFYETFAHPDMSHILWVGVYPENLQYHESWDWLIPVVEKIRSIDHIRISITISQDDEPYGENHCWIQGYGKTWNSIPQFKISKTDLIEAVYACVVEFIAWYNERERKTKSKTL